MEQDAKQAPRYKELDQDLDYQIQFARHNFDNHQALIRSSDAKAAALVTIMVFLAATALQVAKDAVSKLQWHTVGAALTTSVFLLATIALIGAVVGSFLTVQRVLKPRGASHYEAPQKNRDLMWQDHVLLHEGAGGYLEAVGRAPAQLILENLTDQIFELAHISKAKMDALHGARWKVYLAICSWASSIIAGLILLKLN
jgi:hypothetical protein